MLNVLAIGDSIMWGQGNTSERKFVSLVCEWLAGRGKPAQATLLAHSGAIAAPTPRDAAAALWGEVPESSPSVLAQLRGAAGAIQDPDVVLVCAGINDVSAFHIVMANPFDDAGVAKVEQATRQVFDGPVRALLVETLTRFPNAKVVALGYYPIVSATSRGADIAKLMRHLPRPVGVPSTIDRLVEGVADDVIDAAIAAEKKRMVDQCAAFHELSTTLLEGLVGQLRQTHGARVACAFPAFEADNAFAAPNSWLWSGSDDPLHDERVERYTEQLAIDPLAWPLYTPLASMCHPNEAGSTAYARAVAEALESLGY